jgi:hypothetical protein
MLRMPKARKRNTQTPERLLAEQYFCTDTMVAMEAAFGACWQDFATARAELDPDVAEQMRIAMMEAVVRATRMGHRDPDVVSRVAMRLYAQAAARFTKASATPSP